MLETVLQPPEQGLNQEKVQACRGAAQASGGGEWQISGCVYTEESVAYSLQITSQELV